MNRAQRRKLQKDKGKQPDSRKIHAVRKLSAATNQQPDFSSVPLATMCQSIQMLINELYERGYPVYDFDHKSKFVQGIQIIQGKVYFLAAEEDEDDGKA